MRKANIRILSLLLALMLCLSLAPAAGAAESFSDVNPSDWYYSSVMKCAALGIVQGFEDGKFYPDDTVTGIQFYVMVMRTFCNGAVEEARKTETSTWYAPYMKVAGSKPFPGVTAYASDENKLMDRYDMGHILGLIADGTGLSSSISAEDAAKAETEIRDWDSVEQARRGASGFLKICCCLGIITGMEDGCFHGEQTMTRAQACVSIVRLMDLIGGKTTCPEPTTPAQPENPEQLQQPLTNGLHVTVVVANYISKWLDRHSAGK